MKINGIIILVLFLFVPAFSHAEHQVFGAEPRLQGKALSLTDAISAANLNKMIRVEAKVTSVCQKKGCWMMMTDGSRDVRATFKNYGFFVPKDINGKAIIVEGIMSETVIKEAEARHFAEDSGQPAEEIEKIVGDQKKFSFVAETVLVPR